ncbi:SURF1 family protein [Sphaerisporangium sp. B11E5]|uniref:SURF1 family cytochrome oxidase biogenesis protein n=1 Tax=Sphaerisporangium sp. B11E5 TaxID=3153563 RepID=UPI00325DEA3A
MYRFLLTPRWLALHVLVLVLIPCFVLLGRWQFGRFEDRSAASDLAGRNLAAAPVPLEQIDRPGADVPADLRFRGVTVTGTYDPAHELLVRRRVQNGMPGYYVLTPLVTPGGPAVLVNRGWVPMGPTAETPPEVPPPTTGEVSVTGRLRQAETEDSTGISDLPGLPAGQVLLIDTPGIAKRLPYPVFGGFVELAEQRPAAASAPEPVPEPDTGSGGGLNLAYGVQWWLFIGIAIGGWVMLIRREARDLREGTQDEPGDTSAAPSAAARTAPGS